MIKDTTTRTTRTTTITKSFLRSITHYMLVIKKKIFLKADIFETTQQKKKIRLFNNDIRPLCKAGAFSISLDIFKEIFSHFHFKEIFRVKFIEFYQKKLYKRQMSFSGRNLNKFIIRLYCLHLPIFKPALLSCLSNVKLKKVQVDIFIFF